MHAGHQFEIHGWLSEDRAKNNTRRLKMTEQKGIQLDCMHIGQIQFNSHILGNIWVLSVHFPFLCVMKPQLIASWRCRQAPNCVRLTQSAATISPSKSPRTPSRLSQGHNAKMSWPVSPRLARVQCWWGGCHQANGHCVFKRWEQTGLCLWNWAPVKLSCPVPDLEQGSLSCVHSLHFMAVQKQRRGPGCSVKINNNTIEQPTTESNQKRKHGEITMEPDASMASASNGHVKSENNWFWQRGK